MAIKISSGGTTQTFTSREDVSLKEEDKADNQNKEAESAKPKVDEKKNHKDSKVEKETETENEAEENSEENEDDEFNYLDETDEDEEDDEDSEDEEDKPKKKNGVEKRISKLVKEKNQLRDEIDNLKRLITSQNNGNTKEENKQSNFEADLEKPKRADFEDYDDYVEALTDYKVKVLNKKSKEEQLNAELEAKTQEIMSKWKDKVEEATKRYNDWDVVQKSQIWLSSFQRAEILDHERGADILYYLYKNPSKNTDIQKLSPGRQAKAIVEIGDKLLEKLGGTKKTPKKVSNNHEPIKPFEKSSVTHKKDPSKMGFKEYRLLALKQMNKV